MNEPTQENPSFAPPGAKTTTAGTPSSSKTAVISGIVGGGVVALFVGLLLLVGVFNTGGTKTIIQQSAGSTGGDSGDLQTVNQIYKKVGPGVVSIRSKVSEPASVLGGGSQEGQASGSGFVIDKDGYILTNAHVVQGSSGVEVQFGENTTVPAKIVGSDISSDLALLKVDTKKSLLHPVPLGDSTKLEVGNPVIAIGNPFGFNRTVTTGIVSAVQRKINAPNGFQIDHAIQTDAAVNPGNSGGPLLDANGDVIGINSQIATAGGTEGNVGIAFAVPISTVKAAIESLKDKGKVDHAYLGISTATLTSDVADRLNITGFREGALVQKVVQGGPAGKAGLVAGNTIANVDGAQLVLGGDLIIEVDGKKIVTNDDVAEAIADNKSGQTIKIIAVRKGKRKNFDVKLGSRPNDIKQPVDPQLAP